MTVTAVHAHRGSPDAANVIRENTLDAFLRARRLGADGVELDVRLTADGALAVHHDASLFGLGPIGDLTADQLPPSVALLPAALDACEGLVVNIEIKNLPGEPEFDPGERAALDVAELVAARGRAETTVVSSFWPGALDAVHRARPEIPTGLLVASWFDPSGCVPIAVDHACTAVHPHVSLVTGDLVNEAHAAGLSVAAWTLNEGPQVEMMVALGVDTVITDDVTLALTARDRAPGGRPGDGPGHAGS
ncbi:MAG TPA: glycerophosphodiester phosphodiesterase [Acidimicrobiales bacterium]|nr:glycerophosphodiester phosphodiesterase [Acidimicrobiales bacterium]